MLNLATLQARQWLQEKTSRQWGTCRLMKEKRWGWQEEGATDHFYLPPFLTAQLKLHTITHPDCQSGNGWCVCFLSVFFSMTHFLALTTQQALCSCSNGAVTGRTSHLILSEPSLISSLSLSFVRHEPSLLASLTSRLTFVEAPFTSGRLEMEISAVFVCQRHPSFLTLMTRLVNNGW